ncbi:hypothetical protein RBB77_19865 [Tunturibacter psychrotolerans]|uniref:DUF2975 domain-containing protein n=1 Tax=Tunturiibacter psychrotolerans TaxID=3069686 RepID=A0AAU7ZP07_9BACT
MGLMDAPEYKSRPSIFFKLRMFWLKGELWQQLIVVLSLAIFTQLLGYGCGRAIDCKPGQQDGQCGLGTSMGLLVGFFAACGIVVFGVAGTVLKKISAKREKTGRRPIAVGKILGVGLGLILFYVGSPTLFQYRAYLAAGNSSAVVLSAVEVVAGCWLILRAFFKRSLS